MSDPVRAARCPCGSSCPPAFRVTLRRRLAWGIWGGITPLAPGQYVREIEGSERNGFWVDTTYHLTVVDNPA
ncbi:hypothetical protein RB628_10900 [Streptomyces sp. ADMS]|uniref:hypothetical protein n=1 Tax=Streptomyces sp. ADMS TaxID=3071415 RepID=UPI00297007B5|nr:hypothetical protein [Streptomyces sp. ADMS]MDW4905826.1 hypothetical protein [Streptomyces sp. ADMS]